MIAYILTEGQSDVEILQHVLPKQAMEDVLLVPSGNLSEAKSLARSLLVRRRVPVALVMDAGSVVPEVIQERRQSAEESIGSVAGNVPYKVIVAIPALEVALFHDPAVLARLFQQKTSDALRLLAHYDPGKALDQLLAASDTLRDRRDLLQALSPQDLEVIQQSGPIRDLTAFLQVAHERAPEKRAPQVKASETSSMTHAEKILAAVAVLARTRAQDVFSRDEIRRQAGISREEWHASYSPIFQAMRSDHPGGAPGIRTRFKGVFRQVERGRHTLTDYGRQLLQDFAS